MTATWITKITITNLGSRLANITGTRTNNEDIRTYTLSGICVDATDVPLTIIKTNVVNDLYKMYTDEIEKENAITTMINGWEAAIDNDLNAKEL